ncbi:hypothetical protein Ga0609869_002418 [Rhodovulum iodosum]|uniref:Uncharacterized protein n=1 Tax=Rhodovulum iodosum TaxID=68291 RepID=A0ABV3XUP4_9RHOB|nr:hypothetical protein [Rhodovulum robiginosum]RSK35107.1 hypothetical protein EJA01_06845 [Rhodovulum robiginosum]
MFRLALLLVLVAAGPAAAQSQLARGLIPDLRRAGVDEACIASLRSHDFAVLKGIRDNPDISAGERRLRLRQRADKGCGGAPSFLREVISLPRG